jgi:NTP pyrophosphatase (non-canonical NTP hydrolase)
MKFTKPIRKFGLNEYQEEALRTAFYPNQGNNLYYPVLGLCGEAGEVAEKIKKIMRDKSGIVSDADRRALKKELGDVLWYLAITADELGFRLSDVAKTNVEKLADREKRNLLSGEGDDR